MKIGYIDLTELIKSIQRKEGNPDCFGSSNGQCEHLDCYWREYCINGSQEKLSEKALGYKSDKNLPHKEKQIFHF